MTDRTVIDGNMIKQDLGTPGQGKFIITPGDDIGSPGQFLGNVAGAMAMTSLPAATSNATIDFQRFNSSGTWTKPTGLNASSPVLIRKWNGGASGALNTNAGGGGGGGFQELWTTLGALGATETVTIGAGGVARTSLNDGQTGGVSSFGSLLTGGEGGTGGNNTNGGDGGGPLTSGAARISDDFTSSPAVTYHGKGGAAGPGRAGIWHGGGGGAAAGTGTGGDSVYGGAGGGGTSSTTAALGGKSVNGGNGGNAGVNGASGTAGAQPAGGGGAAENTGGASSGAGGAGRIDVIVFGFPA